MKPWEEVSKPEMITFLALWTLMDVMQLPDMKEYWTTNFYMAPIFGVAMPRDRWLQIYHALHAVNQAAADASGISDRDSPNWVPSYKIQVG